MFPLSIPCTRRATYKLTASLGPSSGVKDEIDIEWTTSNTSSWDSNWFWEGDVGNYDHGATHRASNTDEQYHVYTIDWSPSELSWALDGKTVRTIQKAKQTDQRFPQTPSRVQFSVWPAGISSSPQGVSFERRRRQQVAPPPRLLNKIC